jgi:hypothetical protein
MKFDQLIREGRDTDAVRLFARQYYERGKIGHTRMLLLVRVADEHEELTDRAEAAERAVERLLDALDHGARCPQAGMWDECHDYGDRKCRACRKAWAMKEGK